MAYAPEGDFGTAIRKRRIVRSARGVDVRRFLATADAEYPFINVPGISTPTAS
jgi:hypothetical protein